MEATFVKTVYTDATARQRLYKLSEATTLSRMYDEEAQAPSYDHVLVSAVACYSGPEVLIFAADEKGNVLDWSEKPGSFRGSLDYRQALWGFLQAVSS